MAKTQESTPLQNRPADEYQFYYFNDLVAAGIVRNRADLHRKIYNEDFPRPEKSSRAMQAVAPFRKSKVHEWLDRRAARLDGDIKDDVKGAAPPKRPRGRPRKDASVEILRE